MRAIVFLVAVASAARAEPPRFRVEAPEAVRATVLEALRADKLAVDEAELAAVRALTVEKEGDARFALTISPDGRLTLRSLHRAERMAAITVETRLTRDALASAIATAIARFRQWVRRPLAYLELRLVGGGRDAVDCLMRLAGEPLAKPIAIDGSPDHLAFVVRLPPTETEAKLLARWRDALANRSLCPARARRDAITVEKHGLRVAYGQ